MNLSLLELQKAVFERLSGDLSWDVYDDVPENASLPYVVTSGILSDTWKDKIKAGEEVVFTIDIWSEYPGKKEVLEIAIAAVQSLTRVPLSLSGFNVYCEEMEDLQILVDIDGKTRHGVLRYRLLVEEA